jgi:hypothetical protein
MYCTVLYFLRLTLLPQQWPLPTTTVVSAGIQFHHTSHEDDFPSLIESQYERKPTTDYDFGNSLLA